MELIWSKCRASLISTKARTEKSQHVVNEFLAHVKNGTYEPDSIGKEIEYLEGKRDITATKKEAQFKGNLLKGLWQKHFFLCSAY